MAPQPRARLVVVDLASQGGQCLRAWASSLGALHAWFLPPAFPCRIAPTNRALHINLSPWISIDRSPRTLPGQQLDHAAPAPRCHAPLGPSAAFDSLTDPSDIEFQRSV